MDEIREELKVKGGVDRVFDGPAFDRSTDPGSTTDLRDFVDDDLIQMNTNRTEGFMLTFCIKLFGPKYKIKFISHSL
ncbi:hypothetical protein L1887_33888 [Cichorium endivia]|nr:hypothetical protein L1887_33888 [Cichorium endivia]